MAIAQDKKPEQPQSGTRFSSKIFEVHNRDPRDIYGAIRMLGSGVPGSDLSFNEPTHTITVRDFPENIATIEEAIKRLDHVVPQPPGIEMKVAILIGSTSALPGSPVPDDLTPVVKQLGSTLRYSHYGLMAANVHRSAVGEGIEGAGVAEPTLLGMQPEQGKPIFYSYKLRHISMGTSADRPTINAENLEFNMRIPINVGGGTQYQSVGFQTPVSIRQNEKVVIGTTTLGEKAVIVVLTANEEK